MVLTSWLGLETNRFNVKIMSVCEGVEEETDG
jgi:hypothetical protein